MVNEDEDYNYVLPEKTQRPLLTDEQLSFLEIKRDEVEPFLDELGINTSQKLQRCRNLDTRLEQKMKAVYIDVILLLQERLISDTKYELKDLDIVTCLSFENKLYTNQVLNNPTPTNPTNPTPTNTLNTGFKIDLKTIVKLSKQDIQEGFLE